MRRYDRTIGVAEGALLCVTSFIHTFAGAWNEPYLPAILSNSGISLPLRRTNGTDSRKKQSQHAPVTLDEVPDGYVDLSVQARGQGLMQFFRMCEAARGGPLDGRHLVCDDDPTCVKCIPEYKMRAANRMISAYTNSTLKLQRAAFLRASFPPAATVVVIAANLRAMHLVLNWACGCESRGMPDVWGSTLILATDARSHALAVSSGFHALHPAMLDHAMAEAPNATKQERIGGFNTAMGSLWVVMSEMIEAGFTVIAQDADIVWTRDPRPVYSQPSLIDIRSELAPAVGSRSPANTGFVIVQPNKKTLAFAHAMVHLVPITYWRSCDQLAFNSVLRHWRFRQLHYESLPRRLFLDLHIEGGREPFNATRQYGMPSG